MAESQNRRERQTEDGLTPDSSTTASLETLPKIRESPGVRRIEAITSTWGFNDRAVFFSGLVVFNFARSMAQTCMGTYQSIALDEWGISSKSALVGTVRQALTSSTLPIFAKLSDYIGRVFVVFVAVTCWIIGPTLVATSDGLGQYLPGFVIYTTAHVAANVINYAVAIDTTTLRNRLFVQLASAIPSIIIVWAGGVIAQKMVDGAGWRWGAGMWPIIVPVSAVGFVGALLFGSYRAKRRGLLDTIPSSLRLLTSRKQWVHLFWVMDIIGLTLLAGALCLILLPMTLGKGSAALWKTANVVTPMVIGICLIPIFAVWELKFARFPIFPFRHMKDRHVISLLLLSLLQNTASSTRGSYLYFTLVVSFNQSVEGATRIRSIDGFATSITVIIVAFILRKFRMVKPIVVSGAVLLVVSLGMLIRYRGGYSKHELAGLIAGEVMNGISDGLMYQPGLIAMQAKLSHEHALLVTSCYAIGTQAGAGIANAIAGAIWTNKLPGLLLNCLEKANIPNAKKEALAVYRSPLTWVKSNPPGSPAREAVLTAYRDIQRSITIAGIAFAAVCVPLALLMDNVKLEDKHSLVEADQDDLLAQQLAQQQGKPALATELPREGKADEKAAVDEKR